MYVTVEFNSVELEAALINYCEIEHPTIDFKQVEFQIKNDQIVKVLVKEKAPE